MKLTSSQIKNTSVISGTTVADSLNTLHTLVGGGVGDMFKNIYDTNNDGKVDIAEVAETAPWSGIGGKPTEFPPSLHNHTIAEVTNLQTSLDSKANSTHTHVVSDVTGLQTALDAKQDDLVSGVNIKTINGDSLLGSGNLVISGGGGGASDHGALTGLADDDHTQYHNDARGDARYSPLGHSHSNATTSVAGFMSAADKTKLDSVSSGATANSSDAALLNRANHTGAQAQSTITNLTTDLAAKQATLVSGTNIKTINGNSILGSGNILISGGGGSSEPLETSLTYKTDGSVNTVTEDGVVKTFTYNGDGTVATIYWSVGGGLTRTQTYTYTSGVLTSMSTTEG